jgi:hypothetical protein
MDLLSSLKQTFAQKIPGGLSEQATSRLNKTLRHYVRQVKETGGTEQDILRETYASMAKWLKRNTTFIGSSTSDPDEPGPKRMGPKVVKQTGDFFRMSPLTMASFDGMQDYTTGITMPSEDEESPLDKFERIKARRANPSEVHELETVPVTRVQQKDFLMKQDDVIKYREVEYNLFMNSKDRDWVNNTKENRYNFAVQLDSAARPQGTGAQATLTNRFRNITKIEFVKMILPVEGLDVVVQRDCLSTTAPSKPEISFVSPLALPYITVIMDEMTGNNYGTNEQIDKSLAVCQYDAVWKSETTSSDKTVNRGHTLFFPKFIKAQRIYAPTPLASLQKMSFSIRNPENQILSTLPDAMPVTDIFFGSNTSIVSCYYDSNGEYLFIKSATWFPIWSFSVLDRLQFAGLESTAGNEDIVEWLQQEAGHVVIGTAHDAGTSILTIVDGVNDSGYANYIVIRNRFVDPQGGVSARRVFNAEIAPNIPVLLMKGSTLNVSRQVQMTLRITVRELDSTTNLRPDNV